MRRRGTRTRRRGIRHARGAAGCLILSRQCFTPQLQGTVVTAAPLSALTSMGPLGSICVTKAIVGPRQHRLSRRVRRPDLQRSESARRQVRRDPRDHGDDRGPLRSQARRQPRAQLRAEGYDGHRSVAPPQVAPGVRRLATVAGDRLGREHRPARRRGRPQDPRVEATSREGLPLVPRALPRREAPTHHHTDRRARTQPRRSAPMRPSGPERLPRSRAVRVPKSTGIRRPAASRASRISCTARSSGTARPSHKIFASGGERSSERTARGDNSSASSRTPSRPRQRATLGRPVTASRPANKAATCGPGPASDADDRTRHPALNLR